MVSYSLLRNKKKMSHLVNLCNKAQKFLKESNGGFFSFQYTVHIQESPSLYFPLQIHKIRTSTGKKILKLQRKSYHQIVFLTVLDHKKIQNEASFKCHYLCTYNAVH